MLTRNSVVQRTNELIAAPMGEELAMMNMDTGTYFVLDRVAAHIWQQLVSPLDVGTLVDKLTEEYDVSLAQCEANVLQFLHQLHAKGLVRVVGA